MKCNKKGEYKTQSMYPLPLWGIMETIIEHFSSQVIAILKDHINDF